MRYMVRCFIMYVRGERGPVRRVNGSLMTYLRTCQASKVDNKYATMGLYDPANYAVTATVLVMITDELRDWRSLPTMVLKPC